METQAVIQQFQQLPAEAQRIVAALIAPLSKQEDSNPPATETSTEGATILPPLDLSNVPTTWPENEFMNPEFYGAWADREDITDSTEYIRALRRQQWGAKP